VTASEVGALALQQLDLGLREHEGLLAGVALEAHQALVACLDVVAEPDAPDAAGTDVHVVEAQLIRHPLRPLRRVLQRVVEDSLLDVGSDAVRVWVSGAALLLDERGDAADLEGALYLVERVAVVAHQLASL